MLGSLLKLPIRVVRKALGRPQCDARNATAQPTPTTATAPVAAPKAAPPPTAGKTEAPATKAKPAAKASFTVTPGTTPNPNAMKFTVSKTVVESGSISFNSIEEAQGNALGEALFAIDGVAGIFAVNDFVTVIKTDEAGWGGLVPTVTEVIQATL